MICGIDARIRSGDAAWSFLGVLALGMHGLGRVWGLARDLSVSGGGGVRVRSSSRVRTALHYADALADAPGRW